jgi:hypothetical protein
MGFNLKSHGAALVLKQAHTQAVRQSYLWLETQALITRQHVKG